MSKIVRFIACYVAGMLLLMPFWIYGTFGNGVTIEQMVFHIMSGAEGVIGTDISLKRSFVLVNLVAPLFFPGFLASAYWLIGSIRESERKMMLEKRLRLFCSLFLVSSMLLFAYRINLYQYIRSRFGKDTFSGLYADPGKIRFSTPAHKKNLVLIYVESLECDMGHLGPNRIDAIRPIEDLPGYHVSNFIQAPGTGWSIAGMISSQTGVPLKPFYYNEAGDFVGSMAKKSIFPNLTSLSDILSREGYVQYFLVGPDLRFSGMDKFYYGHRYNYAIGRDEWLSRGLDRSLFTGWGNGLHDDTLLDEAYKVITSCRAGKKPFVVTLITTDTHFPDGFPSPRCDSKEAAEGFIGAFKYTSRYLAGFIEKLISEGLLENTDIIIMGDHLFMDSSYQANTWFSEDRHVYFKMITAENRKPSRNTMTHFDVAPTILDLLGRRAGSDTRFGLGISLFSKISPADYDRHLKMVLSEEILSPSVVYDRFWSSK